MSKNNKKKYPSLGSPRKKGNSNRRGRNKPRASNARKLKSRREKRRRASRVEQTLQITIDSNKSDRQVRTAIAGRRLVSLSSKPKIALVQAGQDNQKATLMRTIVRNYDRGFSTPAIRRAGGRKVISTNVGVPIKKA